MRFSLRFLTGDYSPLRTPTVLQMEAVECGAACLGMILAHHGRYEALERLRVACGVSRDGSNAANILKAARGMGLKCKGLRAELGDLKRMPMPLIVFWNFNHFVVLEGFSRGRAWLNDPALGRRSVSETEFDAAFTGVVLAFEPGPDFQRGGSRPSSVVALLARVRDAGPELLHLLLASLALTVPSLVVPAFSQLFVDYYLIQKFEDWLTPLIVGMAVAAVLRAALTALQQHALIRLQTQLSLSWNARFLWHVLRLPIAFFQQRFGGEIGARLALNDRVAALVGGDLAMAVAQALTAAVFLLVMAQYDVTVTTAVAAISGLNFFILWLNQHRTGESSQQVQMDQGKFLGAMLQGVQQIDSFRAAGAEDLLFQRLQGHHAKVVNAEQRLGRQRLLTNMMPQLSAGLLLAAVLLTGGAQVMAGEITLGMLVALQTLAAGLNGPLVGLVGIGTRIQEAQAFIQRLDDVLRHPAAPEFERDEDNNAPAAAGRIHAGRIQLERVTFGYSPLDEPLIRDLDLEVQPGERIAIVGGSGSGKSTLGKLIAGLNIPWSGEIRIDGFSLREWPRSRFRQIVAMVDQEISLFEGTIRDNLTLWNNAIPEALYIQAAKDAGIHDAIVRRPGGYGFAVREGGRNLSQGECQRLEIARALLRQPRILILDEATSSLDPLVEQQIMEAIRRRGITCLIIAHRLSAVRDCDRIVVLDRGGIVETGIHDTLAAAQQGHYRRLVEA